jgi:hypothetical protein
MNDPYTFSFIHIANLDRRYAANRDVGWVYIMRNQAFREPLLKIGKSSRPPMHRAAELGKETSAPGDFELVYFIHTRDHHWAESMAHRALHEYRKVRSKEFFTAPLPLAVRTLDEIAAQVPVLIGPKRAPQVLPQPFELVRFPCPRCGATNQMRQLLVPVTIRCGACKLPIETRAR